MKKGHALKGPVTRRPLARKAARPAKKTVSKAQDLC
jgi:hypothetical protein